MSAVKNTTNYFPRGNKKKSDGDSNFIFNTQKKTNKKDRSRDAKKLLGSKKKRTKRVEGDMFNDEEFIIGKDNESEELEEIEATTNKISSFKPVKGSLLMMSVSQVYKDKYLICNHTRNKKGFMSADNGHVSNKSVGDFIYSVVVSTSSKENDKTFGRKSYKLQLTDNLHIYNTFLSVDKLVKNMQLLGIVESKEEKGYVIDLCFKDHTKAFLNFKDYKGKELKLGSQIAVIVKADKSGSQKIVKCRHHSTIEDITETALAQKSINYELIKPGFLVKCSVESVVDNGLNVLFCKGVSGVIFMDHLKAKLSSYKPKQELIARVITVDFEKKRIGLSELPHVVNLTPVHPKIKIGDVLKNVKVVGNVYGSSYLVQGDSENTGEKVKCFLHKMHVSADAKSTNKNETIKRKRTALDRKDKVSLSVGEKIHCDIRIKEYNYFDDIPLASALPDVNNKPVLSWDTITGGVTVDVTIKDIVGEDYAVVAINEFMTGRLYRDHMTDVPQKKISKKIKSSIGQKVTVKVWKVVKNKKIIEFTMKESLIKERVFVPTEFEDPRVSSGNELTGILCKEHAQGYILEFYNGRKGYLPIRTLEKYNKKFAYVKGSMIECYLLFKAAKGLDLTVSKEESVNFKPKTEMIKGKGGSRKDSLLPDEKTFEVGEKVKGIVTKFDPTKSFPLVLKLAEKQYAYVFFGDLGIDESDDLNNLKSVYEPGALLKNVYVKKIQEQIDREPRIECSLVKPKKEKESLAIGSKVLCRFVRFKHGFGATVQITFKQYGFVDICEIEDDITPGVDQILKDNVFFYGRIIDTYKSKPQISTRQSILDDSSYQLLTNDSSSLEFKKKFGAQKDRGDLRNFIMKYHNWRQLLTENMLVRGYVSTINQHGVFVKIARNFTARASMKEISDNGPVVAADSFLSLNTLALARITSFQKDKVHISLRESILLYGIDEVNISEITPGVKAKLLVLSVADNLAYCQIIGSPYKCRVKLTRDDPKIEIDQKIIARVKGVDAASTPPHITMHEVEECKEEHNEDYYRMQACIQQIKQVQQVDHQHMEVEEDQDQVQIKQDIQELLEHEAESENEEMEEEAKKITQYLQIDQDGEGEDMLLEDEEDEEEPEELKQQVMDVDEQEEEKEESGKNTKGKKEKPKSMHSHIQDEINIMLKERGIEEEEHDDKYYERMLIAEPNNSYLWIHYISYALSKQGYDHAKTLCERAVKTIDITQTKEKLNLWTAYMNLESKFGKEDEFKAIVQRALKINDQKTIYLTVLDIYMQRKNYNIIEGIYMILIKKFNFHLDIWKKYIEFLFLANHIKTNKNHDDHILVKNMDVTDPEKILSRSLQVIKDRKSQVELITKYAIEEYKYGNTEKGKTMLESVIHSYPKRTDIISTYLDMEIKYVKKKQPVRNVFEKLLARDNVKINQIKFLFKRYLEFEVEHGTEKDVERVKQKAADFAAKFGKTDQDAEGESSQEENGQQDDAQEEQNDQEGEDQYEAEDESEESD